MKKEHVPMSGFDPNLPQPDPGAPDGRNPSPPQAPWPAREVLEWAMRAARRIRRPASMVVGLLQVAAAYAQSGDAARCGQIVDDVINFASDFSAVDHGFVLAQAGYVRALLKDEATARSLFSEAMRLGTKETDFKKYAVPYRVVELMCSLGWAEDARSVAHGIGVEPYRSTALTAILESQLASGDTASALATALEIREPWRLVTEVLVKLAATGCAGEREKVVIERLLADR